MADNFSMNDDALLEELRRRNVSKFDSNSPEYKARVEQEAQDQAAKNERAKKMEDQAIVPGIFGAILEGQRAPLTVYGEKVGGGSGGGRYLDMAQGLRDEAKSLRYGDPELEQKNKRMDDEALYEYLRNRSDDQFKRDQLSQQKQMSDARLAEERRQANIQADLKRKDLEQSATKVAKEKEPTSDQFKAGTFAKRTESANKILNELAAKGYDRASYSSGLEDLLPAPLQSSNLKSQNQAEDNFLNAVLRRESGASISPSERESGERQYFPRAGDTPDVLAQKEANRRQVIEGLKAESGAAFGRIPTAEIAEVKPGFGTAIADKARKPKTVIQNGHTYTLNEATGEYE